MKILLVDDEADILQSLQAMMTRLPGHEVRTATSGEAALEAAQTMGGVDLLITDVVMEPMDGFTLRDAVQSAWPNARTLFITGYDLSDYASQTDGYRVLPKPIASAAFMGAIHRELAALLPAAAPKVDSAMPETVFQRAARTATPEEDPNPVAVPVAAAKAAPVASYAAVPTVKPAVRAAAAQPVVKAVSTASPVAAPTARAVATKEAHPRQDRQPGLAIPVVPPPTQIPAPPPGAGESLIGQTVGAYQIVSYLGEGRLGSAYAAVQISINRPVGLKVLDPERAADESIRGRFIADARAKAHVQHPSILAVYEAGESGGRFFFAREYVDGQSLAEVASSGRRLPEPTMLKVAKAVAEGFLYFQTQNIAHHQLELSKVFVSTEGNPRVANLAIQVADQHITPVQELQMLGQLLTRVADLPNYSQGLKMLLTRMQQAPASGLNAWGQVIQAIKALEPKVVPTEAAKITAQDRAAIKAVEAARKSQRRSFWFNVGSLLLLFGIVVYLALARFVFTNERKIQRMVKVPAGSYKLLGGRSVNIEQDFWIDKYEVTIAQYQRFLDHLDKNPTEDQEYRHPRMPRHLEHKPEYWDIYYKQARVNGAAHSVKIDLNSPALTVTWWDAYAYAKWLGRQTGTERDLPTEEEWEVAASGDKGYKYPWGNEFDENRANTNLDWHNGDPRAKGEKDGFVYWSSVDALSGDRSPLGVIGMGGNLAEWTASWTKDNKFPIIKGGDFTHPPATIDKRISDHKADKGEEWIGFRTISRTAPIDVE